MYATADHPVIIDSAVIRRNHVAAYVMAPGSRIGRTRVDTTASVYPAVWVGDSVTVESVRIRGAGGHGLIVGLPSSLVLSCDVSGSAGDGIYLVNGGTVTDCNLAGNAGSGLSNQSADTASAGNVWWGDDDGPAGADGDGVSGPVDYTPWRTAPVTLPYVP